MPYRALKALFGYLKGVFDKSIRDGLIESNPCLKIDLPLYKRRCEQAIVKMPEERTFSQSEKNRLINSLNKKRKERPDDVLPYAVELTLYTGMRVGELCALTPADVDLVGHTITINKTFQRINGRDVIWPPKTPKSNRVVTIPQTLANCLKEYMNKCYEIQPDDRLFPYTKSFLNHEMLRGCKKSGVKKIRVHDLRHSHASLLIEMGCQPPLIADRLGH